jgi:hypothetical protein
MNTILIVIICGICLTSVFLIIKKIQNYNVETCSFCLNIIKNDDTFIGNIKDKKKYHKRCFQSK